MGYPPSVKKAIEAMQDLGISEDIVIPVLKKLLVLYDRNFELIEEDNYRTLADAIFERQEEQSRKDKAAISHDKAGPLCKRQRSSENADQDYDSTTTPLKKGEVHQSFTPTSLMELPQSSERNRKKEDTHDSRRALIIEKGKKPLSSNVDPKDRKLASQKASHVDDMHRRRAERDDQHEVIKPIKKRSSNAPSLVPAHKPHYVFNGKRSIHMMSDITNGTEKVKISAIDEIGNEHLPNFVYIPDNIAYQNAYVHVSLARIADEDCCPNCIGDCLSLTVPCSCARETKGEFAYTPEGLLKEEFLNDCIGMKKEPQKHHLVYCEDCPLERAKNAERPEPCKGHVLRKFIKECWRKCGCSMQCGNRVVQRGINCSSLQVFLTEGKGWGLRAVEDLPRGTFVCEYAGEILTNIELYERNKRNRDNERHTYPVLLDADWAYEKVLKDEDALCLDATFYGNVARFINHRCFDANLIDIPVEVENPDHHYYHLAFFTKTDVKAFEELTWDYGIDFEDHNHPIEAFECCCESANCRDMKRYEKVPNQFDKHSKR